MRKYLYFYLGELSDSRSAGYGGCCVKMSEGWRRASS